MQWTGAARGQRDWLLRRAHAEAHELTSCLRPPLPADRIAATLQLLTFFFIAVFAFEPRNFCETGFERFTGFTVGDTPATLDIPTLSYSPCKIDSEWQQLSSLGLGGQPGPLREERYGLLPTGAVQLHPKRLSLLDFSACPHCLSVVLAAAVGDYTPPAGYPGTSNGTALGQWLAGLGQPDQEAVSATQGCTALHRAGWRGACPQLCACAFRRRCRLPTQHLIHGASTVLRCPARHGCEQRVAGLLLATPAQYLAAVDDEFPNFFQLPVLMLMLITLLNDGTLISVGYDNVRHSPRPGERSLGC